MSETASQQRERVLSNGTNTSAEDYDLAVHLGYEPESWDGMWKLAPKPFIRLGRLIIVREYKRVGVLRYRIQVDTR